MIIAEAGVDVVVVVDGQTEGDLVFAEAVDVAAVAAEDTDGGIGAAHVHAAFPIDRKALCGNDTQRIVEIGRTKPIEISPIGGKLN